MRGEFKKKHVYLFILAPFLLMTACGQKTDEDLIKELMNEAGECIEKKELNGLMILLADDYSDFRGRDKVKTHDMVQSYFDQFRGIVIHILHIRIDEIKPQEASLQCDVALSSGAARTFRKLIRVSTENYRLGLRLRKIGERWLIQYAEWKYIGFDELFPESMSILEKIFSNE
jgi:hypothetical protein